MRSVGSHDNESQCLQLAPRQRCGPAGWGDSSGSEGWLLDQGMGLHSTAVAVGTKRAHPLAACLNNH